LLSRKGDLNIKHLTSLVVALLVATSIAPAQAIVNGEVAVGSNFVVATWIGEGTPQAGCTGAYLRPRVVVTGAHCVIKDGGRAPTLKGPIEQFYVSQTGIDLKSPNARDSRVRVLKVWTEPDYFNRWEPEKNLKETQVNDLAFLFLEKELDGIPLSREATQQEVEEFRQGSLKAFHLGYGMIGGPNGLIAPNDGKPYLVEGIVGTQEHPSHIPLRERHLNVIYPAGKSIGPGDSGSPLMLKKGNEVLYLGTIYAGGGWVDLAKGNLAVRGVASVTVLWPFMKNLNEEWNSFLIQEKQLLEAASMKRELELKAALELEKKMTEAKELGQFYREQASCHSNGILANLQSNKSGTWADVATVLGWITINERCHQPWTIYRAERNELLRWRLAVIGSWEVFSTPIAESTSIREAEIMNARIKAQQDEEARVLAEIAAAERAAAEQKAKEKPIATKAPSNRKTIICTKGKITKRVTANNPKCPTGFRKR
jgi:hypothetical protein